MRQITNGLTLSILILAGCTSASSLVEFVDEPAGNNCQFGGSRVNSGLDDDGDGTLSGSEVTDTTYVCNGAAGGVSIIATSAEPEGSNCANGGQRVDAGVDDNANGTLDASEVDSTTYVCNGGIGLVSVSNEPGGSNCAYGGQRIDVGIDDDGDGTLAASEVDNTTYVCNGDAGFDTIVNIEPATDECTGAGFVVVSGLDTDRDGTLDDSEIESTTPVCIEGGWPATEGIQTDISLSELQDEGWTICYQDTYDVQLTAADIRTACTGQGRYVMLACADDTTDSNNLVVAAADLEEVVLPAVEDGSGSADHRLSNGVGWYYTENYSVGFFLEGDTLSRSQADTATGTNPELRLSWHTLGTTGGYRCGATTGLNNGTTWSRYVLTF